MDISVQDELCGCPAKIANTGAASDWLTFACHNLGGKDIYSYDNNGNVNGDDAMGYTYHGDWYRFGAKNASLKNENNNNGSIGNWSTSYHAAYPFQNNSADWDYDTHSDNNPLTGNPCPDGWKLPTIDQWEAVISTSNNAYTDLGSGWSNDVAKFSSVKQYGDYLYLPAAGLRYNGSGNLGNRGGSGYYWSSSANDSDGRFMYFSSGYQGVGYAGRQFGYSVRCVSAE
jgi:uncharacterized protein (TIGR02145 family)